MRTLLAQSAAEDARSKPLPPLEAAPVWDGHNDVPISCARGSAM